MPSREDSAAEKKRQKKLHLQKLKTLQKMCGEALKDYESLKTKIENNSSEMDHSLLQSKINVVKRVLCEMQQVAKSIGKAGYFVGNFYLRKHSMMETKRKKGLQRYYITEIPETYIRELSPATNLNFDGLDLTNPRLNNAPYNPHTPHLHNITPLDDYETQIDEEPPSESPFDNLETLMKHPAHLSVFFHYLISNSNPSALCLFYITSELKQISKNKGLIQFLYSLYCTFLQEYATMKVEIRKEIIDEVRVIIESEKPIKKRKDIVMVLKMIHDDCLAFVQILLDDFKFKRLLGLGSLFGDRDLHNNMDSYARELVIEKSLWAHFGEYSEDGWNSYSLCLISCIATFFKMFGFSPQTSSFSKNLDTCPIFRQKNKSSFSQGSFPSLNSKDRIFLIKDHHFTAPKYETQQNCHLCGRWLCSIGDYGLNCKDCHKHYHKACVNLLEFNCEIARRNKLRAKDESVRFSAASGIPGFDKLQTDRKFVSNSTIQHLTTKTNEISNGILYGTQSSGSGLSPVFSLNSQPDFNQTIGSVSSLQPFPILDLVEVVSLRDTLCLNNTLDKREFKKKSAIEELVSSETMHVRFLKILYNVHYIPMFDKFPRDFVMLVFPNLHQVIGIHNDLKNDFKTLMYEKNIDYLDKVSQILLKHFSGERGTICKEIFSAFIEKQSYAIKILKVRQANDPELDNFIKDKMNHPLCDRLSLQDLLSKVMQRISKYPMLIKNLIKLAQDCTPSVLDTLENVLWHVEKITSFVNRTVHEFETRMRLYSLQKRLLIKPIERINNNLPCLDIYKSLDLTNHKLLFDGPLRWQVNSTYSIPLHVVLLEEMIILLQKHHQQSSQLLETLTRSINQKITPSSLLLSYHSTLITEGKEDTRTTHSPIIPLSDLIITPVANDTKSFFLVSTSKHGPLLYNLSADTSQEMRQWIQYLRTATQTYKDKKYKPSFFYGVDSKRQKYAQKKTIVPNELSSGNKIVSNAPSGQRYEIKRELSMPSDISEWSLLMGDDSEKNMIESTPDLRTIPISDKDYDDEDSVFQDSPLIDIKFTAKSVDNLIVEDDRMSSNDLYAMYLEFNNFMEALGEFLDDNSSSSNATSLSSKHLRKWNNRLHYKLKGVLEVFNKNGSDVSNHPLKRSFSDEGTSA